MSSIVYDVAIVGSGFAGSLLAMIARRQGRSVILLEKGTHPKFAIGESSTPLSNLLLEELALRYDLPGIAPLAKWGTWMQSAPHLDCGLKRGFTFYQHECGKPAARDPEHRDQLLVSASPHDAIADTHWHRAEVDHHFLREACGMGVDYLDDVALQFAVEGADFAQLQGRRQGQDVDIRARFVVDATGPRGFLHRSFSLPELSLPGFPQTQGLFTHFVDVRRLEDLPEIQCAGAPYPPDDAAVHHVFDGGWIWVLRFRSGITSAGVASTGDLSGGAPAWNRLLQTLPTVRDQFANASAIRPFSYAPRLSFRSGVVAGRRWALLPSAAGFVDPLLSSGFPMVLLGVARLGEIIGQHFGTDRMASELAVYAQQTDEDLLATARLIGGLYAGMNNFPLFVSLSLLYFAAASYSEAARRLGKPHLARAFLLQHNPDFRQQFIALTDRARSFPADAEALNADILRAIEPFNVAGLGRDHSRNWYPAEADDLRRGAAKLESTPEEVTALMRRCGFE